MPRPFIPTPVEIRAPLKLVLCGEYAVLEPSAAGIVLALDRAMICRAYPREAGIVVHAAEVSSSALRATGPDPDGSIRFPGGDGGDPFRFVRAALRLGYRYVAEMGLTPTPLRLDLLGHEARLSPDPSGPKLGLGTSAAVVVAVLAAVLGRSGVPIDRSTYRHQLLQLALAAHTIAQGGVGSGIDVAAAVVGGAVIFKRPIREVFELLASDGIEAASALDLARLPFPGLEVERVEPYRGMHVLAGFVGVSASTTDRVRIFEAWSEKQPDEHDAFITQSKQATALIATGLRRRAAPLLHQGIVAAREALLSLEGKLGTTLETPALRRLAELALAEGAAGKLSGAGGGDCGIAIAFTSRSAQAVEAAWRAEGIVPVPIAVSHRGVCERPIEPEPRP